MTRSPFAAFEGDPDRTVHAERHDMQIVRYDRASHWYVETVYAAGGLSRRQVTVREAARIARTYLAQVHFGLPGGRAFDAHVRNFYVA